MCIQFIRVKLFDTWVIFQLLRYRWIGYIKCVPGVTSEPPQPRFHETELDKPKTLRWGQWCIRAIVLWHIRDTHSLNRSFLLLKLHYSLLKCLSGSCNFQPLIYTKYILIYLLCYQVSYGSTSVALTDQEYYPTFFRTVTPDSSHNAARASFIEYFKWNMVASLSQEEELFSLVSSNVDSKLLVQGSVSQRLIDFKLT